MSGGHSGSDSDQPVLRNIRPEPIEIKVECPEDYGDDDNSYYEDNDPYLDQNRSTINDLFAISNFNSYYEDPEPEMFHPEIIDDPPARHVYTREYGGQYDGWNRTSTRHLISLYRRYRDRIGSLEIKSKKQMWDIISKSLAQEFKLKFTAAHCENRWRVLERNYRKIIVQQRNGRPNRTFEFFDDLNLIFRKHKDRDRKPMAPPLQPKVLQKIEPNPVIQPPPAILNNPNLNCTLVRTNPNPTLPNSGQNLTLLRFVPNLQNTGQSTSGVNYPLLITSLNKQEAVKQEPKESPKVVSNGVTVKPVEIEHKPKFIRRRKRNVLSLIRKDLKNCNVERLKVEKQKLAVKEKKLVLMQEANKIMSDRNEILKDFIKKVTGGVNVLNGLVAADLV